MIPIFDLVNFCGGLYLGFNGLGGNNFSSWQAYAPIIISTGLKSRQEIARDNENVRIYREIMARDCSLENRCEEVSSSTVVVSAQGLFKGLTVSSLEVLAGYAVGYAVNKFV